MGKRVPSAFELLTKDIAENCKRTGISLDTYDPDFILSSVMQWLGEHDAILTSTGIEKIR